MNIAVFASHGGSDLQAIIDGCKSNKISAKVAVVISNNGDSMALQRAKNENIPAYHMSAKKYGDEDLLAKEILNVLSEYDVDNLIFPSLPCTQNSEEDSMAIFLPFCIASFCVWY